MGVNLTKIAKLANIKDRLRRYIECSKWVIKSPRFLDISILAVFAFFVVWTAGSSISAHLKNNELMQKLEYLQNGKLKAQKDGALLEAEAKAVNDPIYVERILREQRKIPQGELLLIDK